eukprot:CAMPEP_0170630238 /NCGR_PEP_ID=MMETSP0224-20130122/33858_1 /TAXON_ID=285029 /ORGANISM="Togula jolla, Strain CCCM 725" /LENGTH=111 /DNA_ID=CAMNT_0010958211 /DNA_START=1 /DNA_END=337 /DNA_ORIENTATION=-
MPYRDGNHRGKNVADLRKKPSKVNPRRQGARNCRGLETVPSGAIEAMHLDDHASDYLLHPDTQDGKHRSGGTHHDECNCSRSAPRYRSIPPTARVDYQYLLNVSVRREVLR